MVGIAGFRLVDLARFGNFGGLDGCRGRFVDAGSFKVYLRKWSRVKQRRRSKNFDIFIYY